MNYRLQNVVTELDWQLAFLAVQHAEAKPLKLTYATPIGDIAMRVQQKGGFVTVKNLGKVTEVEQES